MVRLITESIIIPDQYIIISIKDIPSYLFSLTAVIETPRHLMMSSLSNYLHCLLSIVKFSQQTRIIVGWN